MTRPPLGIEDKLWLEYLADLDKENTAELEDYRASGKKTMGRHEKEVAIYRSLPWWRKLFTSDPTLAFPRLPIGPFIAGASLEGFLTWKAKGKKL